MPTLVGFGTFASVPEETVTDKIRRRMIAGEQGMLVWWSMQAGAHIAAHQHTNEQIVWMLKGRMAFRIGEERRTCGPGDIAVIPSGVEHEGWIEEDTEVIDVFAPPREDFLSGGAPAYLAQS